MSPNKITPNHHIEVLGHTNKVGGKNIDVKLLYRDVRNTSHSGYASIPIRHAVNDAIGFGCGCESLGRALRSKLKSVAKYSINTPARKNALLQNHLVLSVRILNSSDR